MAKTNRSDGSYATADLFEPHPHIKNAWKYHSRSDSQITLLTGKKFDPAPFENAICSSSKLIRDVVIFGNGRQYPGALIFLSSFIDQKEEQQLWDVISRINEEVEAHNRIERNMIAWIIADELTPEKSSKGTVLRGPTEEKFADHIERLYGERGRSLPPGMGLIQDSEIGSMTGNIVHEVLGFRLRDDQDFYRHGVDSTLATRIRSKIQAVSVLP